jgi:polar amino acid transport system substrate-binding protein
MPPPARFLAAACLALLCHGARAGETITLTAGEWLPYVSGQAPHYGPVAHIVSAAFALEGVTVNYVFRPWSRAYAEAASGLADGSVGWSTTKGDTDRNRRFYFSDVLFDGQSVFFHLKSRPFRWTTFERLADVKIGGTAGYEYRFDKDPRIKIDRSAGTDELNFRKLAAGRFDIFPATLDVGLYILRHDLPPEQASQITWDPRPYNTTHYHMILNKKPAANKRYMALFNRGLQRLKDSGKYAQYIQEISQERTRTD